MTTCIVFFFTAVTFLAGMSFQTFLDNLWVSHPRVANALSLAFFACVVGDIGIMIGLAWHRRLGGL